MAITSGTVPPLVVGAAIGVAVAFVISDTDPNTFVADRHPYFGNETLVGRAFMDAAKRRLPDPTAAEFKDVKIYLTDDGSGAVCGLVNARTASHPGPGFEPFLANSDRVVFRSDVASDAEYQALAERVCRQAGSASTPRSSGSPVSR